MACEETGIRVPIQAQVTLDTTGRMLLGSDIAAVLTILEGFPIAALGLNCSTGPDYMREAIRYLGENSPVPVSCIPNAGLPLNVDGQAVYPLQPQPFAETLSDFVARYGVGIVGGCCGTTPEHLHTLVQMLGSAARQPKPRPTWCAPRLASGVQAMAMQQEPRPFLIGERLNTQGSQKFKKLILAEDFEGAREIAEQQINSGAHGLDLCLALTERSDEAQSMVRLIQTLRLTTRVPFIFDTTEPEVMEAALKAAPGRCLINSTNLEGGRARFDRVLGLAKHYNAAVILLTIDEQGMAKTAERKLEIARRMYAIAVDEFGLRPCDLVFDALTFTLATGQVEFANSAVETLEGIRQIKAELPGVLTSLGVSNCSFGLTPPARAVLNSVMLYHAVQAGLDMAIVNPAQITPYAEISAEQRLLAEDLIFNRRADALARYVEYFSSHGGEGQRVDANQQALQAMSPRQRLHHAILHRRREGVEADIDLILAEEATQPKSEVAVQILNEVLLPAMKEVGDKFGTGELILPFVLQSAEVMKKAVAHLEQYLERKEGVSKGTVVLATVYGDVHDIGKNLVKTILVNNGYVVHDLGKQVPAETVISKAVELQADAIGLSALLVSTSKQMPLIVNELHRRRLHFPVLIGGAAINQRFGRRILRTDDGRWYEPGVFYCKDAFEGLATMDALSDAQQRPALLAQVRRQAEMELNRSTGTDSAPQAQTGRRSVLPAERIPTPPGWGVRVVRQMPLDVVFEHLSKNELFRLSWGAKNTHGEAWQKLQAEYEQRLQAMRRQALQEGWLKPQGVYGYWPAQADGDDLILFDPQTLTSGTPQERARFHFPRQSDGETLCLADYFLPLGAPQMDVVALQVVTVGQEASERFEALQEAGEYSEAYFRHGLAVQTAEACAEYLHRHIRRELGLAEGQGKRYSWGYPAIPDLADHAVVFDLLPAQAELGMRLTAAYQLVPEQSTAAIIVHHPLAKYYNVGEGRINALLRE
jgi:5-methyltetrahydrofolate--homocysteine methyltransferase